MDSWHTSITGEAANNGFLCSFFSFFFVTTTDKEYTKGDPLLMKKKALYKKGMAQFIDYAIGFGVAVVGLVIVVILLQTMQTSTGNNMCANSAYVFNQSSGNCNDPGNVSATSGASFAGNITGQGLSFANNFSQQWGLAGTILGYVLVLAILALIGVGAYFGYNKVRGSR